MRILSRNLRFGPLTLDPTAVDAFVDESAVGLTPSEFRVLYALASNEEQVMGREALVEAVSGRRNQSSRAIDAFVKRIRSKLSEVLPEYVFVHSDPGSGYMFHSVLKLDLDDDALVFTRDILPLIRNEPVTILAEATGLSYGYCYQIKTGQHVPHRRHWEALRRAVTG
jgi:DNA-binding winged helix-turn-helix (wHTH) protein